MSKPKKNEPRQQSRVRLSIIIPYYNAEPYTSMLLERLRPQITNEVEVIVVDDGSKVPFETGHDFVQVIRQQNQGCSAARNVGIDKAKGDYISFIDADDMVARYFVEKILEKTKDEPDVIEFSWQSLNSNNWNLNVKLNNDNERLSNPSVCTRAFKRSFIGDVRFNIKKDSTEDEDFSRRCGYKIPLGDNKPLRENKTVVIPDYMYYYRDDVTMSKTKRYAAGLCHTKRVVYFYHHVTDRMTWLLDEIKKEDEVNEVFLQTYECDLPELKKYCQIEKPHNAWGHIIRGEQCDHLTKKDIPTRTQIVIYRRIFSKVGGLLTFVRNFVRELGDKYDITILCEQMDNERYMQLLPEVRVIVGLDKMIVCDSLIVLSFLDHLPKNVSADRVIRMCHACRTDLSWHIPEDYDDLIYVSRTAMESFGVEDGKVIHNLKAKYDDEILLLVSASRFPAPDKGDIEGRTRKLCDKLNRAGIPFMWLNFSDGALPNPPKHFYNMGVSYDMESVIKKADYVVALSDSECWSYTVLESLTAGVALICTPFPSAFEMGVEDGVNAHVIPFDMDFDVNILKDIPRFKYAYNNAEIKMQWEDVLGAPKDYDRYNPEQMVLVRVNVGYLDMKMGKHLNVGEEHMMTKQRAQQIINTNPSYIEIIREC